MFLCFEIAAVHSLSCSSCRLLRVGLATPCSTLCIRVFTLAISHHVVANKFIPVMLCISLVGPAVLANAHVHALHGTAWHDAHQRVQQPAARDHFHLLPPVLVRLMQMAVVVSISMFGNSTRTPDLHPLHALALTTSPRSAAECNCCG